MKEPSRPKDPAGWNPSSWLSNETTFAIWCITAAFGAYFCMYGIRKPFTATTYEGMTAFGMELKSALVITQVFGLSLIHI